MPTKISPTVIVIWTKGLDMEVECAECGRVFDLLNEIDAVEHVYGHDCEVGVDKTK